MSSAHGVSRSTPRLDGQAEDPLADDVALHLVRPGGDAVAGRAGEQLAPRVGAPLARVGDESRPEQLADHVADRAQSLGVAELAERPLRSRRLPGTGAGGDALVVPAGHRQSRVQRGEVLADHRVVGPPEVLGELQHLAPLPGPAPTAGGAALEAERRHRHTPAVADPAEAQVVADAHVVEEHLVERRPTAHLAERTDLHARRVHRHDERGEPDVLGHVRIGSADDVAVVGVAGAGRPHLLAVDDPLVAVADGLGGQAGEVRAGAGFGEQLAPHLVGATQLGEEPLLLLRGAPGADRRADQLQGDAQRLVVRRGLELRLLTRVRPGVRRRQPAAAELRCPVDRGVPGVGLVLLPGASGVDDRRVLLVGRVVEHGDVVGALAPGALDAFRARLGVGRQPRACAGDELVEGRGGAHE